MLRFFLSLLLLIVALYIFIQTPFGQNWITGQVTKRLSRDLETKVSIKHVDFSLFNYMHLQGILVEDRGRDTLLYAHELRVRITDWFFFKKEAELKYLGLEDAIVKFQRTDSVWRQQFFFDYFTSPSTGKKKKAGIVFDLKKLELKNVVFVKKDAWLGEDIIIKLGLFQLDANDLNLSGKNIDINSIDITDPVVILTNYKKLKPAATDVENQSSINSIDSLLKWNSGGIQIKVAALKIKNGLFRADKQNDNPILAWFDGQHIEFRKINSEMTAVQLIGDSIFSKFSLSAIERSGFEVKKMLADLKMTPTGMAFTNLDIQTNKSVIKKSFAMNYDDIGDMNDFIHKVKMTADFDGSYIDSDDIAFFAPGMKTWKKKITLYGKARGTVDALVGKELIIQAGSSTLLNGDISLNGLPNIDQTFIDFTANDFRTTYADAVTFVPAIRNVTNPDLRKIQYLNFKGSFTGFIRDFVTFGTIQTNLGAVTSDLNMKLPRRGQQPAYSGNIATDNFRLGEFLGNPDIGVISMKGTVKGSGFNDKNRNATLDGIIHYVDYKNYRYNNITVKGKLDKKLFDGTASINDENAQMTLNGILDFNSKTPVFDLFADVQKANLKNLHLSDDSLEFKGKFNLDFTGNNIDNFVGIATITEGELTKEGNRLPFDTLTLSSTYKNNVKTLTVASNEFAGTISGDFNINDLPNAFQLFLNKYYPAYIKPPKSYPRNESFQFDFTTNFIDDYIKMVDSTLSGFNYSHIYGDLNLGNNQLNLHADVPHFKFKQYNFDDVKLQAHGSFDSLSLTGIAKNIFINDSLNVPVATFKINARNDSSRVNITTGANQTVDKANLNALVLTYTDGVKIEFDPSDFVVNGKNWTIDESGELQFRKSAAASGQLVLREGEQVIRIKTVPSAKGDWNDINAELIKINIGDFSPYFMPKNRLEGLASGTVFIEDPIHKFNAAGDIQTEGLILDNDSLGNINAHIEYNNTSGVLIAKGKNTDNDHRIDFDVNLFLKEKTKEENNHITINTYKYSIKILERFLGELFSDMEGYITGPVNFNGPLNELNISGKAKLEDAGLKVNFTQCFYKIETTDIELKPTEINLNGIVLTDTATGNPIYVKGSIEHTSFKNMFYKVDVATRKPGTTGELNNRPVLLLNTAYKDNKQFYGYVKGTGSFSLAGPQSEMFMQIAVIASNIDSSYVTIPPSSSRESGMANFLVERKYGHEMLVDNYYSNASNIIYDVDITANPLVNVKVVLDELTGDEIKGRGEGTLNIHSGTSEPLSIRGRFDIDEGNYLFTFQSLFKKPFELKKGADNYIEWSGDPYKARIHFDAIYTASNVSFAPLASSLQLDGNISRSRSDVYVIASLTDELFKPTIRFKLDFPPSSPAKNDPGLSFIIQQIEKNTNDINKQVTYLIVFNSFAPSELTATTSGAGFNINDIATTTISGMLLGVINDEINKIFSKLFSNQKLSFNFNTSIYNRNIIDINNKTALNLGSNVNFTIGRSFFNNRFTITAGGGFEAPLQQTGNQQSVQLLPDLTMEWVINKSGSIRASFFYRENADYLTTNLSGPGRARRFGSNLSYRKEFDNLRNLFRRSSGKPKLPVVEQQPADDK